MKGYKIIKIIKVFLEDIILELHFNVKNANKAYSFTLSISDDGETILYDKKESWVALNDINYEDYSVVEINRDSHELSKLLENEITNVQYGIGKTLDAKKEVIYYIKINTDKNEFLFFNNGDEGCYSFDDVEEILANDIYGYKWKNNLLTSNPNTTLQMKN